nr:MAG TPA: triphosphate pyrophosphohydrolase [Caudoviricetes sp.]
MSIDLNKLTNYKSIAYATPLSQLNKIKEEYQELLDEVEVKSLTYSFIKNKENFIAEGLDLITATVNLLLVTGVTDDDFNKHIAKLESYKNGKYKR